MRKIIAIAAIIWLAINSLMERGYPCDEETK
jgi:hypothetical protein